jgi:HEAT repeat protein
VIALGRLGDRSAFAPLAAQLNDGPADVRFQAARSLAEIDAPAAYEPLVKALADSDPEVRTSVCEALVLVADRRAAGWLADLLGDTDRRVRFAAACTLGFLGDARGLSELTAALPDRARAWDAIESLEAAGDARAAEPLAAQMRRRFLQPVLRVRAAAAICLVAPGTPLATEARAFLDKQAGSRREEVRGLAAELLEHIAAERHA